MHEFLVLTGASDLPYPHWEMTTPYARHHGIQLAGYHLLVLHYNGPRWGEVTEQANEDGLRSGKGMIAVHAVSYGAFYGQELIPQHRSMKGMPLPAYADMMEVACWQRPGRIRKRTVPGMKSP